MTDHFRVAVHCVGKKGVKDPFRASCSLWREERCEGLPPEQAVHCGGKKGVWTRTEPTILAERE